MLDGPVPHRRDAVRGARSGPTARRCGTTACASSASSAAAQLVGQFYLDPYARTGKRPGAWMDDVRGRWRAARRRAADAGGAPGVQLRAAASAASPALLTHDDVITLFHEFGHGLHHMLTQVDDIGVAGISGVEWDAVELPSQFMENFCWEWDVRQAPDRARRHRRAAAARAVRQDGRGEELPERPADAAPGRVRAVRHARCTREPGSDDARAAGARRGARARWRCSMPPPFNRFQHSFSHIFAGGYCGRLLQLQVGRGAVRRRLERVRGSAACFDRRHRPALPRSEILEAGGSRPAMEASRPFAAASRRIDALLRHQGMA